MKGRKRAMVEMELEVARERKEEEVWKKSGWHVDTRMSKRRMGSSWWRGKDG